LQKEWIPYQSVDDLWRKVLKQPLCVPGRTGTACAHDGRAGLTVLNARVSYKPLCATDDYTLIVLAATPG